MKLSILAAREQRAVQNIADQLSAHGIEVNFDGIRGDSRHRHMFMLERIADALSALESPERGVTIEEVLSIEGLTKTSKEAIQAHYGNTE